MEINIIGSNRTLKGEKYFLRNQKKWEKHQTIFKVFSEDHSSVNNRWLNENSKISLFQLKLQSFICCRCQTLGLFYYNFPKYFCSWSLISKQREKQRKLESIFCFSSRTLLITHRPSRPVCGLCHRPSQLIRSPNSAPKCHLSPLENPSLHPTPHMWVSNFIGRLKQLSLFPA